MNPRRESRRRGTILIVTMWIVLALTALVLMLAQVMHVESFCSANEQSALQAQAVEQGAVQYVLTRVDSLLGQMPLETDTPCQAVQIGAGAFWIIRPYFVDENATTYGITDEAGKLNVNTAPAAQMALLPNMTDELAAAIVDWRDSDENTSTGGAESDYYMLLPNPYLCKNSPLETVEELFLVKGFTPELLFGEDTNRNGALDINENDADASDPPDNRDGRLDRGIRPFITVYSREPNTDANGAQRVNVASGQGQALTNLLAKAFSQSRAIEILALARQQARLRQFTSTLDFYVRCGLTPTEFAAIADRITTSTATTLRGLVNVSTAPKQVLACLPGMEDSDATALASARMQGGMDLSNIGWVTQVLAPAKLTAIGPYITARTYRFSADIVSVSADGRAFRRCRIVVDAQNSPPKVIYRQDLTFLGWPLDPQILSGLRAGVPIEDAAPIQTVVEGAR